MMNLTILVAVSDLFFLTKIKTALELQGCRVRVATQVQSLLQEAVDQKPSLIILDLGLPMLDPAMLLRELRQASLSYDLPVVAYTHHSQVAQWQERLKDKLLKVVPNSYISDKIKDIAELIRHVKQQGLDVKV